MNILERISAWFRKHFTPQATMEELQAELHMRASLSRARVRRKTRKGATHQHREAGKGRRRRSYLPAILGSTKRPMHRGSLRLLPPCAPGAGSRAAGGDHDERPAAERVRRATTRNERTARRLKRQGVTRRNEDD